jgi:hypothetical protein
MVRAAGRPTRLSRYAEDRRLFAALVRLNLAVKLRDLDGRVLHRLTPLGAALFVALMDGEPRPRIGGCP